MCEKVPCEYCNNDKYYEAVYWDGKLFCCETCRTLGREDKEKRLQAVINAKNAVRQRSGYG